MMIGIGKCQKDHIEKIEVKDFSKENQTMGGRQTEKIEKRCNI